MTTAILPVFLTTIGGTGLRFGGGLLGMLALLCGGYAAYTFEQGNFHTITAAEAYRSAQLYSNKLEYYIKEYHIKSILNLRGKNFDAQWYKDEMEVSRRPVFEEMGSCKLSMVKDS